jgi:hypothetical protein
MKNETSYPTGGCPRWNRLIRNNPWGFVLQEGILWVLALKEAVPCGGIPVGGRPMRNDPRDYLREDLFMSDNPGEIIS